MVVYMVVVVVVVVSVLGDGYGIVLGDGVG